MKTVAEKEKLVIEKRDVVKLYNLPTEVRFCKRCTVSNQRPRITFDENGVCSACNYAERKKSIDWNKREKELEELLTQYRRSDGSFDVIVPSSGGKDSTWVAHQLKYKYNMNPLTVTWTPHLYTQVGWDNFQALIAAGLPNILGSPDGKVHRRLTRKCFIKMGEPFQPFIYGQVSFPMHIAVKYKIPLIMDGEMDELEYGGDDSVKTGYTLEEEVKFWFSDLPVDKWLKEGFTKKDLCFYFPPSLDEVISAGTKRHFFGYYKEWDPNEHYEYAVRHIGFKVNPDGRSEGTYSAYASLDDRIDGFHFYLMYIKFGFSRATSDSAHEVRGGHITREEAVKLICKYDHEFPKKYYKDFLEYCDLTEDEFWQVVDSWRSPHLWEKIGGEWKLRYKIS